MSKKPDRFGNTIDHSVQSTTEKSYQTKEGKEVDLKEMKFIPATTFTMGARDPKFARADEYPTHQVKLDAYYIDKHLVTNNEFAAFVKATGYVTTAEKVPTWEELKEYSPPGTPKPADSLLIAASLVFTPPNHPVPFNDPTVWWSWRGGANWRHPQGPNSDIKGKDNHPVVQVSWFDAMAYANWAGKRLVTEAEWEYAARGGHDDYIYSWGNERIYEGDPKANSWDGSFPYRNDLRDGFYDTSPVDQYPPNGFGLLDMAGNVWEWTNDWYRNDYYQECKDGGVAQNPQGVSRKYSYDPNEPGVPKKAQRGGSYLCNDSYCSGYRSASRMKSSPDSGMPHLGFRCAVSVSDITLVN
ncbi:formylglycine-generating enzyme family protein [Halosquirtibacter laminarini]|uniref:formylglycine-generating enzyme family protein n=1 Tax=Halosquirtibacter laminarini TaxID=3374600 RepID=UPI00374999A2